MFLNQLYHSLLVSLLRLAVVWVILYYFHFLSGHAGAIISGGKGKAEDKVAALEAVGVRVTASPAKLGVFMKEEMDKLAAQ
jgi:hypothetical protein